MEISVNNLVQEINQGRMKAQLAAMGSHRYVPVPVEDYMDNLHRSRTNSSARNIYPHRILKTLAIEH